MACIASYWSGLQIQGIVHEVLLTGAWMLYMTIQYVDVAVSVIIHVYVCTMYLQCMSIHVQCIYNAVSIKNRSTQYHSVSLKAIEMEWYQHAQFLENAVWPFVSFRVGQLRGAV